LFEKTDIHFNNIMSQITTHVLDTSLGLPAEGISIVLEKSVNDEKWDKIADGITNKDGRITELLPLDTILEPGDYRLVFNTGAYFRKEGVQGFYPYVYVVFEIIDENYYHIPLLLSPYGYSTYRGS